MDDFIDADPVTTAGLTFPPGSTTLFRTGRFDLMVEDHVLQVEADFADGSRRRNAIKWVVVSNTEP